MCFLEKGEEMFHVGKVKRIIAPKSKNVISSDTTIQVSVKMWDENLLILEVDKKIAGKIKDGDYVIADYRPISSESPYRKMIICKILRGEIGKKMFKEFNDEFQNKKKKKEDASAQVQTPPMPYIR
jgi:hypothetical protein